VASWVSTKGTFEIANLAVASQDLRLLLVDTPPASQAAAQDVNFVADVVADELSGTGYARRTLAGESVTEDDTNNRTSIDATDPAVYTGINAGTIAGGWIYRQVTNDADSPAWAFLDVADIVTNTGDVTLSFHANGIITLS
jgi:hypothetical protein